MGDDRVEFNWKKNFNERKDIALCSELKQLYVAITCTRQRLWIFENGEPSIFKYWKRLQLIQIRKLDYDFLQKIQVASGQEEWKARGVKVSLIFLISSLMLPKNI